MSNHNLLYVPESELNAWKELFNDSKKWGIRSELEAFNSVSRGTLNRILLTGRAYEETINRIREFVEAYKPQYA